MIAGKDDHKKDQPLAWRLASILTEGTPAGTLERPIQRPLIGVLPGCGIGPEVIGAALKVLRAVEQALGFGCEVWQGGAIGEEAESRSGRWLPEEVVEFCEEVFCRGGAILNGPAGRCYVYDLRRRFGLFCKFVPIRPVPELAGAARVSRRVLAGVDILLVRDNIGGVYQGRWGEAVTSEGRVAEHAFSYRETDVRRLIEVAARAAALRRGTLHLIVKDGGLPTITALWREVGASVAQRYGIEARFVNADLAAYELIQNPGRFDVIAAPNLLGDIIADLGGVLMASRGVTYSGNFDTHGHAVYQTNHGCAHDLTGTDTANPAGQVLSLAMMLRESFGRHKAAALIEDALAAVWREGWRTPDLAEPGYRVVGTRAMADKIAERVQAHAEAAQRA